VFEKLRESEIAEFTLNVTTVFAQLNDHILQTDVKVTDCLTVYEFNALHHLLQNNTNDVVPLIENTHFAITYLVMSQLSKLKQLFPAILQNTKVILVALKTVQISSHRFGTSLVRRQENEDRDLSQEIVTRLEQ